MVVLGDFNNGLPAEWTATLFSHVISCEVLCHAASQTTILTQVPSPPGAPNISLAACLPQAFLSANRTRQGPGVSSFSETQFLTQFL